LTFLPARPSQIKPLDEQHLGYLEFLRIDTPNDSRARVRIASGTTFNLDIQI